MKCSACGYENNEEAKFCNACGNKLEEVKIEPQKPVDNPTPVVDPAPPKPVTGNVAKRKFSLPVIIGIIAIIILIVSAGAFAVPAITVNTISFVPTTVPYQETIQTPTQVPYQELETVQNQVPYQEVVQNQVDVTYTKSATWQSIGILDWEIEYTLTILNTDTQGGAFNVYVVFNDHNSPAYTSGSQTQYIQSGQSVDFTFDSSGLSYSTDWQSRYTVTPMITPPKKTVTSYVTKYRTETSTQAVTKYRTEMQSQVVTKYRDENQTVTNTKTVTLIQYLMGNY